MLNALRLWWHGQSTRRKMDRVFGRCADPYRYRSSPYELSRLTAMEAALKGGRYSRALEVGCAEGAFTERLAALADQVTAVDISAVALSRARQRSFPTGNVRWVEADIRSWEPPPGIQFDAVVLGDVLCYLDKPLVQDEFLRTFERIKGWMVPNGNLLAANGFAGPREREIREGYRQRFVDLGFKLLSESVVGDENSGKTCCLLSLLRGKGACAAPRSPGRGVE